MRRNLFISPSPGFVRGWRAGIPKPGVVHSACEQALERITPFTCGRIRRRDLLRYPSRVSEKIMRSYAYQNGTMA